MTNFYCLNNFHSYKIFGEQKVILYFMQLVIWTKKIVWSFSERQEYRFLSCLLSPFCYVSTTVLQIKHHTLEIVLSCHFFRISNTLKAGYAEGK